MLAKIASDEPKPPKVKPIINFPKLVAEIIAKENKIVSGDPQKIKRVNDTWKFSRNIKSQNPNWQLVETEV